MIYYIIHSWFHQWIKNRSKHIMWFIYVHIYYSRSYNFNSLSIGNHWFPDIALSYYFSWNRWLIAYKVIYWMNHFFWISELYWMKRKILFIEVMLKSFSISQIFSRWTFKVPNVIWDGGSITHHCWKSLIRKEWNWPNLGVHECLDKKFFNYMQ